MEGGQNQLEEEDGISSLPDCLIVDILSHLPTKSSIKTGVVSKRWKHLWTFVHTLVFLKNDIPMHIMHSRLNFFSFLQKTITQFRSKEFNKFELHIRFHVGFALQLHDFIRYAIKFDVQELYLSLCNLEYEVQFELNHDTRLSLWLLNKTITQFQSKSFNKFQLHIRSHVGFVSQFHDFIRYAVKFDVRELYLSLCNSEYQVQFELNADTLLSISCCTHLSLARCIFSPSGVISWNKLKSLCVSHVKLDEVLIQKILTGSPLLETLKLEDCRGYRRLDITSKSVKNLVVSGYYPRSDFIEINAPNVLSLTIQKFLYLTKLLLLDVSSLRKAYLSYMIVNGKFHYYEEEILEELIFKLYHVKVLKVGKLCSEVLSRLKSKGLRLPPGIKYIGSDWNGVLLDNGPKDGKVY